MFSQALRDLEQRLSEDVYLASERVKQALQSEFRQALSKQDKSLRASLPTDIVAKVVAAVSNITEDKSIEYSANGFPVKVKTIKTVVAGSEV